METNSINKPRYGEISRNLKYAGDDPAYLKKSIKYAEDEIEYEKDANQKGISGSKQSGSGKTSDSISGKNKNKLRISEKENNPFNRLMNRSSTNHTKTFLKKFTGFKLVPIAVLVMGTVLLMMVMMLHVGHEQRVHAMSGGEGFPEAVETWRSFVNERLTLYSSEYPDSELQRYTGVILTTIWQESDGNPDGPGVNQDIMQSRESGYWSYQIPDDWESLTIPERSIDAGIRYFIECLCVWPVEGPDDTDNLQMVMQGYNYGVAFLEYAHNRGADKWTEELSQAYSVRMGGDYGTVTYAERWLSKYQTAVGGGSWLWPMPTCHDISSGFGARWGTTHRGIDIPCPIGSEVIASNSGTVYYVGEYGTGGNAVIIDCGNGIMNYYYHLSGYAVSEGETVRSGQIIAYSGNTGNSTGPHLHFGVTIDGEYVNPQEYLND